MNSSSFVGKTIMETPMGQRTPVSGYMHIYIAVNLDLQAGGRNNRILRVQMMENKEWRK